MSGVLEVTILGCGSSGGVPRADGAWGDCDPDNPKNFRTRCSLLVRRKGSAPEQETTAVVDASPEFRIQAAQAGVKRQITERACSSEGLPLRTPSPATQFSSQLSAERDRRPEPPHGRPLYPSLPAPSGRVSAVASSNDRPQGITEVPP